MTIEFEAVAKKICLEHKLTFVDFAGAGAFKETFHATDGASELALKVFKPGFSQERTEREISAMLVCDHPNIGKLNHVSIQSHDGKDYLFTIEEFCLGGTLSDKIADQLLEKARVTELAIPLISAVEHIASHGLVHRDLKPDNIMFRADRKSPVIVDFGIVRDLNSESLTKNWLMQGPGSPYYAAPEQLNNQKDLIDWRTDQFSLGVVLAICAFGDHPYCRTGDNMGDVVNRVMAKESSSEQFQQNCVKHGLEPLMKMVQPWPIRRYRTASDLLSAWMTEGEDN